MVQKKISKLSSDCAKGISTDNNVKELQEFNDYYLQNSYDCLLVNKGVEGNSLYFTLMYTLYRYDWLTTIPQLDEEVYQNLAYKLQCSYRDNHYHSQVHAADIVQHLSYVINNCEVDKLCELTPFDIFITLLSAAAHDMDHPGNNNIYEIKCKSKLALLYNDQAVLENHHAASFFFLLDNNKLDCNIMVKFS